MKKHFICFIRFIEATISKTITSDDVVRAVITYADCWAATMQVTTHDKKSHFEKFGKLLEAESALLKVVRRYERCAHDHRG